MLILVFRSSFALLLLFMVILSVSWATSRDEHQTHCHGQFVYSPRLPKNTWKVWCCASQHQLRSAMFVRDILGHPTVGHHKEIRTTQTWVGPASLIVTNCFDHDKPTLTASTTAKHGKREFVVMHQLGIPTLGDQKLLARPYVKMPGLFVVCVCFCCCWGGCCQKWFWSW